MTIATITILSIIVVAQALIIRRLVRNIREALVVTDEILASLKSSASKGQ